MVSNVKLICFNGEFETTFDAIRCEEDATISIIIFFKI